MLGKQIYQISEGFPMQSKYHTETMYHAHLTKYSISEEDITGQGNWLSTCWVKDSNRWTWNKRTIKNTTASKMKQQTVSDIKYGDCIAIRIAKMSAPQAATLRCVQWWLPRGSADAARRIVVLIQTIHAERLARNSLIERGADTKG